MAFYEYMSSQESAEAIAAACLNSREDIRICLDNLAKRLGQLRCNATTIIELQKEVLEEMKLKL